jgi:hypothetical protein
MAVLQGLGSNQVNGRLLILPKTLFFCNGFPSAVVPPGK